MVLLIIVCLLGMSKFITDSTLGTLLGGISGYVLSQGVGRQERHAAQASPSPATGKPVAGEDKAADGSTDDTRHG